MAILSPLPKMQFFSTGGAPLSGGKLYSYAAGTTTPLATYTTQAGTIANTNPIILDSRGEASVWLASAAYKLKLTTADDVEIWTVDNISSAETFGTSQFLSSVSGSDTITATVTSPNFTAYAAGQMFSFVAAATNTTSTVTLNLSGPTGPALGAKSVTKQGTSPLSPGDIQAGQIVLVEYDGTRFQYVNYSYVPVGTGLAQNNNRIINGGFMIDQRNNGVAITGTSASFIADRWQYYFVAPATTVPALVANLQTQTANPGPPVAAKYSGLWNCTTAHPTVAIGDFAYIVQKVEGYSITDLIGQTFTLSFWVRSSKIGTHCVALKNDPVTHTYIATYTVNAANAWEYKTVTITNGLPNTITWNITNGIGLFLSWALMAGVTYQSTAGAWNAGIFLGTSAQVNLGDAVANTFLLTGVQLFPGATVPTFENRSITTETQLCQRYYQSTTANSPSRQYLTNAAITTSRVNAGFLFPVPMRTAPTVTIYAGTTTTAGAVAAYNAAGVAIGTTYAPVATYVGGYAYLEGSVSLTAGSYYTWTHTADAEL
jgi:hypothetical protein